MQVHWFKGSYKQALLEADQKNIPLLTFIYDKSNDSGIMSQRLDSELVYTAIEEKLIPVKVPATSEEALWLGQLSPTNQLPCVFIVSSGRVVYSMVGTMPETVIRSRIKSITDMHSIMDGPPLPETNTFPSIIPRTLSSECDASVAKSTPNKKKIRFHIPDKNKSENHGSHKSIVKMATQPGEDKDNMCPHPMQTDSLDKCELTVRLLDGSLLNLQLSPNETLAQIIGSIKKNRTDSCTSFTLVQRFPYRLFTRKDLSKSMRDLNLCPIATVDMEPPIESHQSVGKNILMRVGSLLSIGSRKT
ncbi:hypothetical protein K7432_000761 [Basidiobolus ranarum]|uniref:UBX domain-containing protein 2 n=1 Tax=Basidiobolus ranarum TaxID=34480 RepID=A0ABR2WAP8_9FUNG